MCALQVPIDNGFYAANDFAVRLGTNLRELLFVYITDRVRSKNLSGVLFFLQFYETPPTPDEDCPWKKLVRC